jgi:protoporphyrinogen/coproporphyrinogen III oxidase
VTVSQRRHASTATNPPNHIAVLGGGISGLTAAFYLGRRFPNTRITLLEAGSRLGGWIQTETIDLGPEYGQAVLEAGPRTLRPVSKPLLELVGFNIVERHSHSPQGRSIC